MWYTPPEGFPCALDDSDTTAGETSELDISGIQPLDNSQENSMDSMEVDMAESACLSDGQGIVNQEPRCMNIPNLRQDANENRMIRNLWPSKQGREFKDQEGKKSPTRNKNANQNF
uniref:Uncharacterized protein n=1 Tax=Graphocephala atropunctata TaxID=36148 RepID=A0A1B6KIK1_9HEMI